MNTYHNEWKNDFNNLFYYARELMKQDAYRKLADKELTAEKKIQAAEQIIESHFLRSAYVFIENADGRRVHPSFREYAAMMLKNDTYRRIFGDEIADALIEKYGTMDGIPTGSYYPLYKK